MPEPGAFGELLRRCREAKGLSQEALAERAGLTANAIGAIERGERRRPYPATVLRLAEALQLTAVQRAELTATVARSPAAAAAPAAAAPPAGPNQDAAPVAPPHELTPLVGRERETAAVLNLLAQPEVRLLTLTGAGGVGKTRLALRVAEAAADRYRDGVIWAPLAALTDPDLVIPTIARRLQVREAPGQLPRSALHAYLRDRQALIVLDNCEHVLGAAREIGELLLACRQLNVLATSRAPLELRGEQEYAVPPLAVPPAYQVCEPVDIAGSPSVGLFVSRAQAAAPDFELTRDNAAQVAAICRRLDGLPLAIELAAARIKLLPPRLLLARLDSRLGLLTGGGRDRPSRHQTLRATIDWSYRLLDAESQVLFARLAVFVGTCSLEAVEQVGGGADGAVGDVLAGLQALVDQSLVRREDAEDEARFGTLETIREYAAERLDASGEAGTRRRRHAEHYLALAEQADAELGGPRQGLWLDRLERDHDNLRAALGWAIEGGESALGLRLAAALGLFWEMRGHLSEGARWLDRVLAADAPTEAAAARATALSAAGNLAVLRGDYATALARLEASLAIRRTLGDRSRLARTLHNLGRVRFHQGDYELAESLYAESLDLQRALGDRRLIAVSLNSRAVLARNRGDDAGAAADYTESLALFRAIGDRWGAGLVLNNLARVARDAGEWARVRDLCAESLTLFQALGDRQGVAWVLSNLAIVARRRGDADRAARLFGASAALAEAIGSASLSLSPTERAAFDQEVAAARAQLGAPAFDAAHAAGCALPLAEAVDFALDGNWRRG